MNKSQSRRNLITVATAVELATRAMMLSMGTNCSKTIGGNRQTRQVIADSVTTRIATHIKDSVRG